MENKYILWHLLNIYRAILAPRKVGVYERLQKAAEQVEKDYRQLCKIEEKLGPMPELSKEGENLFKCVFGLGGNGGE